MSDSIFNVINRLYDKVGFFEKYGGSLWTVIIICLVFFIAISYYQVYNNLQPIKADWINKRCSPLVMPFAGLINPPDPKKMSAFDFTAQNFTYCIQSILGDIIGVFLKPLYYLVNSLTQVLNVLAKSVQEIRKVMSSIRNSVSSISAEIMGKLLNILIPIQFIVIKVKDMMAKTQGVMLSGIFMLMGIYQTLIASLGSIIQIISSILISLATIIIVLFFIPFGLGMPFAIPLLITFMMIVIPGIMIYIIQVMVLKQWVNPLPGIPGCFMGDTVLILHNGTSIQMKDIEPGMILENNSIVTANMKLAVINETIYNLSDVYCTDDHSVKYNDCWIKVKDHPDSIKTEMKCDYVYCINTSNKIICINNEIFGDWDELDNSQILELKYNCLNYLPIKPTLYDIHKYLDGGFVETTKIELYGGNNVNISEIEVNDTLQFGERVVGIVKIKADDLEIKQFQLDNKIVVKGGPNLQICDSSLGMLSTLDMYEGQIQIKEKYLYHLITDTRTFYVNGIKYYDYNSCIDKYLCLEKDKLVRLLKA